MKPQINRQQMITGVTVLIMILALIGSGIFFTSNRSLKKGLNSEKLINERILSEKLQLEKMIEVFKLDINGLNDRNQHLDKLLAETSKNLNQKETELKNIKRENANAKSLKKQLDDLTRLRSDLEDQIKGFQDSMKKLTSDKEMLAGKVASLEEENRKLNENLEVLSSMTADNFMVQATKKKDRLTVKAKRTSKIAVSFKVPTNIAENISFSITKPDGTQVKGNDKSMTVLMSNDEFLYASILTDEIKVNKNIELSYAPKEKLKAGIYKIEMYNNSKYMGSCNVRLR